MSLHNGIDLVAVATIGVYSKTYGLGEENNIANLYASLGYLEDAPTSYSTIPRNFFTILKDCIVNITSFGNFGG